MNDSHYSGCSDKWVGVSGGEGTLHIYVDYVLLRTFTWSLYLGPSLSLSLLISIILRPFYIIISVHSYYVTIAWD